MSYCSLNNNISKDFKTRIDDAIEKCNLGDNNENNWTKHYIILRKIVNNIESDIGKGDVIRCGDNAYFKMTYKNIQRFATEEQSNAYHAFRKSHLCHTMTEAIKGTDFCYKMMGSDSPASDVDISIFSKVLIPKDASTQIEKIIKTYHAENEKAFGGQAMADVFDANIYFTNFLQIFKSNDPQVNVSIKGLQANYSIGNISQGCFDSTYGITMDAKAVYIPSKNNPEQREYASHRFAKYFNYDVGLLKQTIETGVAPTKLNNLFEEQITALFAKCQKNQSGIPSYSEEAYIDLLKLYFKKREDYFMGRMSDEELARELLNKLSLATFLEDEAYHSQGAFLHVNAQKDWNLELDENDYIDSIFENMGFMMEYNDMTKHDGMKAFDRYEKIRKYYGRITEALSKIAEIRAPCDKQLKFNVLRNTRNVEIQDKQRKECSISTNETKRKAYNDMSKSMISNLTDGMVSVTNVDRKSVV